MSICLKEKKNYVGSKNSSYKVRIADGDDGWRLDNTMNSLTRHWKVIYATCTSKNTVDVHVLYVVRVTDHRNRLKATAWVSSWTLNPSSESHINKTCHQDPPSAASKTSPDSDLHSRVSEVLFHITLRLDYRYGVLFRVLSPPSLGLASNTFTGSSVLDLLHEHTLSSPPCSTCI